MNNDIVRGSVTMHIMNRRIQNSLTSGIMLFIFLYCTIFGIITVAFLDFVMNNIYITTLIFFGGPLIPILLYKIYFRIYYGIYYDLNVSYLYNFILNSESRFDGKIVYINFEHIYNRLLKIHQKIKSDEICEICLENNTEIKFNCSSKENIHGGCKDCISKWLKKSNSCPICRKELIKFDEIFDNNDECLDSDSD